MIGVEVSDRSQQVVRLSNMFGTLFVEILD
jgi:hypothetical protein